MIRKMPSWVVGGGVFVLSLVLLSGCVPYKKYTALQDELARSQRGNEDLTQRLHQLAMRLKQVEEGGEVGISDAAYRDLIQKNQDLAAQLASAREAIGRFSQSDIETMRSKGHRVDLGPQGEMIIGDQLLFSSGVARLKEQQLAVLDDLAQLLKSKYPGDMFIIEGNTDDEPLLKTKNLYRDNLNLGYHRARAVFDYLNEKHNIREENFRLVTYGFTNPTERGGLSDEEWRAQCRRVSIRRLVKTGGAVATR